MRPAFFVISHLYSLSVVDLHHVKAETIDSPSWSLENTRFEIEMVADVH